MPIQEIDVLVGYQYKAGEKGTQLRVVLGFTIDGKVVYAYTTENPSLSGDLVEKSWNRQQCQLGRFSKACCSRVGVVKKETLGNIIKKTNSEKLIN